jgi:hypothetical protein
VPAGGTESVYVDVPVMGLAEARGVVSLGGAGRA